MTTRDLLLATPGVEVVPAKTNTYFRVGGVEIASTGGEVAGVAIGSPSVSDAYVNGLKPGAYAHCGAFWKRAWIRRAKTPADKAALRSFFAAFEQLHGIKAGAMK